MADRPLPIPSPTSNVVGLPTAAAAPVRQPRGGAAGAYRKANPWPGLSQPPRFGPREAFELARHELEIARARHDLASTIARREWQFAPREEAQLARDEAWRLFDAWLAATAALAETPAIDAAQLRRKVEAIGPIWLKAEGERFDSYRAAIARDAERLGLKNPLEARARAN